MSLVSFNKLTQDVVVDFEFTTDFRIEIATNEFIDFVSGEQIQIGVSHRFKKIELQELFLQAGFNILTLIMDTSESYALTLASTRSYVK